MAENLSNLNAPAGAKATAVAAAAAVPLSSLIGVEGCCVRQFWAVLEGDGTLVRGRGVARVQKLDVGIYEVFFTGDVSNGAFVTTIGRPGIFTEPTGEITMALRFVAAGPSSPEFNKGVWIQTFDSTGKPSDRAFHLVVHTH